jgi:putative transposase
MARLGRYFLKDQPRHVIQRGNNREAIFFGAGDYAQYRDGLAAAAVEYGCAIHTCVLMTHHVHLLVTPQPADSLPRTMQSLGRRYVRHVNAAYRRTGTLWEGRYRAAPTDGEAYFLSCCRTIEPQPSASPDGPTSARVSLVELSRPYARRDRPVAEQSRTA